MTGFVEPIHNISEIVKLVCPECRTSRPIATTTEVCDASPCLSKVPRPELKPEFLFGIALEDEYGGSIVVILENTEAERFFGQPPRKDARVINGVLSPYFEAIGGNSLVNCSSWIRNRTKDVARKVRGPFLDYLLAPGDHETEGMWFRLVDTKLVLAKDLDEC